MSRDSTALSILDLVRVTEETDARGALDNARDIAVHAEACGYRRIWVAEHHNMPGIASAATSVVIGHIAAGTKTIRVGAGCIMLPNHAPYVIAEQFGTLARLFPGRIDLGLGRAPGTDQRSHVRIRDKCAMFPRCPKSMAEREGLPRRSSKINKISRLTIVRLVRVYQCCALNSSPYGPIALSHLDDQKLPQRSPLAATVGGLVHSPLHSEELELNPAQVELSASHGIRSWVPHVGFQE